MQVKLKVQVMVPFINIYLPKGTILDVAEVKGKWYICQNKEVDGVFIQKDNCEVLDMTKELEIVRKLQHCGVEEYGIALEKVEKILLEYEQIKNAKPSEALEELEQDIKGRVILAEDKQLKLCAVIKQALLKAQEQEKENELLKEIIKSFFDRGCPLHQYTDKEGILTIEVDNECSIMHLGEFKGVDLDKKLKEVLK